MRDESFEMMKAIVALELGIVPLDMDASKSLGKMEESEAKKSKRKFRKIKRKLMRVDQDGKKQPKSVTKSDIHRHVEKIARDILSRRE